MSEYIVYRKFINIYMEKLLKNVFQCIVQVFLIYRSNKKCLCKICSAPSTLRLVFTPSTSTIANKNKSTGQIFLRKLYLCEIFIKSTSVCSLAT